MANRTNNSQFKKLASLALIVALAGSLSACGRKGALEAPASAQIDDAASKSEKTTSKPDKKFILDGLI